MDVVVQTVIKWFKQLSGKEILCITVLAGATVVVTIRRKRPDDRKPPFVTHTAWPLVGHLPAILKFNRAVPVFGVNELARESYVLGGVCRFWTPMGNSIAVTDPNLIEEIMTQADYGKEPLSLTRVFTLVRLGAGNGLFTADDSDPEWGIAHRILTQPFSRQGMISFVPLMNEQVSVYRDSFVHSIP